MFGVEKLRPDWQVKTYVIPISRIESDAEFWTEAQTLKNAWNEITAAYRAFDEQVAALDRELARLRKEKLDDEEVRAALSQIRAERKEITLAAWKAQGPKVLYNDLETLRMGVESALSLAYKNDAAAARHFAESGVKYIYILSGDNFTTVVRKSASHCRDK